ncbi:MAG: glycosyltransferase [Pseudomonadota bacterium]
MQTEIIIATYNSPRALTLTLTSILNQRVAPNQVCIADDGSGSETSALIERYQRDHPGLNLRHVWHEDRGFEKWKIVNKAIATSEAEFLIFLDGDVMIHPGFVARHLELARPGRFSTGSLIRLGPETTAIVTEDMIKSGFVFDIDWLRAHGVIDRLGTWLKTMPLPKRVMALMDRVTPVQRALCGANASLFRQDALKVNGFDESIKYGGGDKEFGIRLTNAGIPGQHLRYTAPLVHLDHPRSYRNPEEVQRHRTLIERAKSEKRTWTPQGIEKVSDPDQVASTDTAETP